MKNNIKKIIVAVFSLVLIFAGQSAFAETKSVSWNTYSNDCSTIAIANDTQNIGFGNRCWVGRNISADEGDYIKVRIYYHNTGTSTAQNTRLRIIKSGNSTNFNFSGQIISNAGTYYSSNPSSVSLNIPSGQTLDFERTEWYPNQTISNPIISGQEILSSSGLSIGNIAPGWDTQGTAMAIFRVSDNQPEVCEITEFTATEPTITSGDSSLLEWGTSNCSSVSISPNVGSGLAPNGSHSVSPTVSTTYNLTAYNLNGTVGDTGSVRVTVINAPMSGTLTANPDFCKIPAGQSTCTIPFTWSTTNPIGTSSVTHNGTTVATGNNGSQSFTVAYGDQTYYLYNNGDQLANETVTASCFPGTSWNGSKCVGVTVMNCTIENFSSNTYWINQNGSAVLSWRTNNCTSATLSNPNTGSQPVAVTGTKTVSPDVTTIYTLTARGANSSTVTETLTINVQTVNPAMNGNLTANPDFCTIPAGQSTCLIPFSWTTNRPIGTSSVTHNGTTVATGNNGSQSFTVAYGEQNYYLYNAGQLLDTEIVTASCSPGTNWNGSKCLGIVANTCRIIDFSASDTSIDEGDSTLLSWETEDCQSVEISSIGDVSEDGTKRVYPTSDKTYVLTAYRFDGGTVTESLRINVDEDNNNNDDDCRIDSFTASSTYIDRGDDVTLRWRTTDCDDVSISNFGDVDDDGSEEFSPNNTTTYTLRARGDNGSDSESIRITVGNDYNNNPIYNTNVVTTIATNITQTSAQLNGLVTSTNYASASTYFEYGTNVNLGMRTASRPTGGNSYFNEYVSNLSPNTIYYFRAVGEGSNGISRGSIEVFRTLGYTTTYTNTNTNTNTRIIRETVVEQGNTVYGSLSPIMLRIENRYQTIGVGDVVDYTIYYKNISISRLTNPMVQVFVPKGIIMTNSSRGTFSNESRTLSVPIADLNPEDEGVIYLQAVVEDLDANLAQIVTTAVLIYTNPNGAQENAMAYALNNPKMLNGNVLGASAFFGNILGLSLIGWLLLIILIMLLVLLSRSYYGRRNTVTTTTERTIHQ